jgi:hypothetical protein
MGYEESRALLGEPERPRRPVPLAAVLVIAALCALAGGAAGLVVSAKRETRAAEEARAAAVADAAEQARFAAAKFEELERAVAAAETLASDEAVRRARAEVEAVRSAGVAAILRSVVKASVDGVPGAPPRRAIHQILRGEVLESLREGLPGDAALELWLAVVRSMALDPRVADGAAARADLDFARRFLDEVQATVPATSELRVEALLAVAQMSFAYAAFPALEEAARAVLRDNAATSAAAAIEATRASGGRRHAEALEVRARLAEARGELAAAVADLEVARAALGDRPEMRDSARVAVRLASLWAEVGRAPDAVQLLRVEAGVAARAFPAGSDEELGLRRELATILARDASDPAARNAALGERIAVGRLLVALERPIAAREVLSEALRAAMDDETRFRERLEAATWLARAIDLLGATEAALALVEEPRIREDARIQGEKTVLARDHAALVEALRAKAAARKAAGK